MPSIVVQETDTSARSVPRPTLPSLDLTQMRNTFGAGCSSGFVGQDRLQPSYSPQSDAGEEAGSSARSWSSIGGPESQIASSGGSPELYIPKNPQSNNRSHPMDEDEASQVVQSLNQSAWGGAIRSTSTRATARGRRLGRSAGSDQE